jgi:hypothetical protein
MHAITGPDRRLLQPIHDALSRAVAMALCTWAASGTTLDGLRETASAIHGDVHQIVHAHSGEILTLAAMTETRLRGIGNDRAADYIACRIQSMARALVHEPYGGAEE